MAKTYKNLYPQIYSFENLYQAHRQARQGGKRKRPEVAEFEHNLAENLLALQTDLREQTYRPGPYRHFIVIERKVRKISAAPYCDKLTPKVRPGDPFIKTLKVLKTFRVWLTQEK